MKYALIFGIVVLISCLCQQINAKGSGVRMLSRQYDYKPCAYVPEEVKNACVKYWCDDHENIFSESCFSHIALCKPGETLVPAYEDLTEKYPACCRRPSCRKV